MQYAMCHIEHAVTGGVNDVQAACFFHQPVHYVGSFELSRQRP